MNIQDVIDKIKKETGESLLLGNSEELKLDRIPFGIPELDKIVGGGLVRGRTHIFKGGYSSGKSFLMMMLMIGVQRSRGMTAIIDMERSFDPDWAKFLGLDLDDIIIAHPGYGERALDVVISLIKTGVDVVAVDSIASLIPLAEEEEGMEASLMAPLARMMNKALRKITVVNKKTVFIGINQERESLGRMASNVLPAGKGQEFFASIILDVARGDWIKGSDNITKLGFYIKCMITKNKVGRPYEECSLPFMFGKGIEEILGIFNSAVDANKITKEGRVFFFEGEKLGTKNAALDLLRSNKELLEKVKSGL